MSKLVYSFAEGDGKNKKLLGGKGANLCEMTQIGINVPPGFVITTEPLGEDREERDERARGEQARGLMFREELPSDRGMLFIFQREDWRSFWMKLSMVRDEVEKR